jgi:hypothetical protein
MSSVGRHRPAGRAPAGSPWRRRPAGRGRSRAGGSGTRIRRWSFERPYFFREHFRAGELAELDARITRLAARGSCRCRSRSLGSVDGRPIGTRVMLSTPAAMTMSIEPAITACAAKCSACCDDPHCRSTEVPGTLSGNLEASTAPRAMLVACSPAWPTQPMITSSIRAGSTPVRATSSSSTWAARSAGCQPATRPPFLPPAVRTAATIYACVMLSPGSESGEFRPSILRDRPAPCPSPIPTISPTRGRRRTVPTCALYAQGCRRLPHVAGPSPLDCADRRCLGVMHVTRLLLQSDIRWPQDMRRFPERMHRPYPGR